MRVDHSTGVVLPVVAASLMGAGSVLAFGLIASPGNAEVRSAEPAAQAAPVLAASTAPPPITLTGPVGTAGTGRAVLAAEPVRHPRAQRPTGRDPRTASARPVQTHQTDQAAPFVPAENVPPARIGPPPVTLVRELSRSGRLVTVRIIDPALATPRTPARPAARRSAPVPAPPSWRRGAVGG